MNYLSDLPLGQALLAYPNSDKKAKDHLVESKLQCLNTKDTVLRNYVHVSTGEGDGSDLWVQEDFLVLRALPVLLVDSMPFSLSMQDTQSQPSENRLSIPANTIIALHDDEFFLDYLKVSYLDSRDEKNQKVQTGYIPNPHPFFSRASDDLAAIRLYTEANNLSAAEVEAKKALLDSALALTGLSPKVRAMIQAERKKLDPQPKANVSYERLRIPSSLQGTSKSRYGVNMSELLKGGTEDPWAKRK